MLRAINCIALLLGLTFYAAIAHAQTNSSTPSGSEQTFLDFQVEQAVRIKTPVVPSYPESLRAAGVKGEVLVQFVVDEQGHAQMSTFKVLRSNDNLFTEAAKRAVSATEFHPAQMNGQKVKQLVQQPYRFGASK